jgi:hypothetical protein
MIIEILAADARVTVGVGIVTPTEDSRIGDIVREEIAEPMDAIRGRPCLLSMAIQAMDGDDTDGDVRMSRTVCGTGLLDDRIDPFYHDL